MSFISHEGNFEIVVTTLGTYGRTNGSWSIYRLPRVSDDEAIAEGETETMPNAGLAQEAAINQARACARELDGGLGMDQESIEWFAEPALQLERNPKDKENLRYYGGFIVKCKGIVRTGRTSETFANETVAMRNGRDLREKAFADLKASMA